MNLVNRYFQAGIEGIPYFEFKQILEGKHPVRVKISNGGMVMLSTNKTIKCTKHYYAPLTGPLSLKKVTNECYYVQTGLNIKGVQNYDCSSCHLKCLQMREEKALIRKI